MLGAIADHRGSVYRRKSEGVRKMDAVKYVNEKIRMCRSFSTCQSCREELKLNKCVNQLETENTKLAVDAVEQWSKEHPIMTNKMKFEEVFGDTCVENGELVLVRPSWWFEEYREPKGE